jgi:hypothetical protein
MHLLAREPRPERANWNAAHDTVVTCGGYGTGTPYDLVIGDVYSVLTFGNNVQVRDVTGIKLWQALGERREPCPTTIPASGTCAGRFPQVSGNQVLLRRDEREWLLG